MWAKLRHVCVGAVGVVLKHGLFIILATLRVWELGQGPFIHSAWLRREDPVEA